MPLLRINAIQRFCLHDGPGIRTVAFLQGCPLRCWWCHNPEARPATSPGAQEWDVRSLVDHVARDARFWKTSGGGVTVSGGEPLMQGQAVAVLLEGLGRLGHHRCIETAGHVPLQAVQRVSPHVDLWLWDLKSVDADRFRAGTGGDARLPLANLVWLLRQTATPVRVRVPIIAGFSDDDGAMAQLADTIAALPRPVFVELLPGHDLRKTARPTARSATVTTQRVAAAVQGMRARGLSLIGADA